MATVLGTRLARSLAAVRLAGRGRRGARADRARTARHRPRPCAQGGSAVDTAQPPRRPLRVLVVDDDPDTAGSLTLLLQSLGYDVRTALGGAEALATAATFAPEAAVLDLAM